MQKAKVYIMGIEVDSTTNTYTLWAAYQVGQMVNFGWRNDQLMNQPCIPFNSVLSRLHSTFDQKTFGQKTFLLTYYKVDTAMSMSFVRQSLGQQKTNCLFYVLLAKCLSAKCFRPKEVDTNLKIKICSKKCSLLPDIAQPEKSIEMSSWFMKKMTRWWND